MGLTFDRISVQHEISLCKPVPTNTWNPGVLPGQTECGVFVRDIKNFPYNDEPSGGATGRISPGEMFLAYVKVQNYPGAGRIRIVWARLPENTTMFEFARDVPGKADPSWTWWDWFAYSFIGYFPGELDHAGDYYVLIDTTWGTARYDFSVTDTRDETILKLVEEKFIKPLLDKIAALNLALMDALSTAKDALAGVEREAAERKQDILGIWAKLESWLVERIVRILFAGLSKEAREYNQQRRKT